MDGDMILRINPVGGYIKVETKENGVTSHKEITNDTLVECLRGSIKRPNFFSGLLPENCISFYAGTDEERSVTILHPERYADISYHNSCYQKFPLPRLVFKFTLQQKLRVQSVSVGVVPEGRLKPDTKMFEWPFSNVSGFRMCIGNNVMPKCENLYTLASLPYHILALPNNNDHYNPINNRLRMEFRDLLEHMKDKEPEYYYEKILVPSKKTLADFIQPEH